MICIYCGAETELYFHGRAICVECSVERFPSNPEKQNEENPDPESQES